MCCLLILNRRHWEALWTLAHLSLGRLGGSGELTTPQTDQQMVIRQGTWLDMMRLYSGLTSEWFTIEQKALGGTAECRAPFSCPF